MNQQILWAIIAQTALIVAGAVVVIAFNSARFNAVDKRFDASDKRIDDLKSSIDKRFDDLKDWIRSEIRRLEERIERIEHPVTKP